MYKVSVSIVLFNSNVQEIQTIIDLLDKSIIIYLIDNSLLDNLKILEKNQQTIYIHTPSNPGFGAAHNIAIRKVIEDGFNFHLIINPDIYFKEDVITSMVNFMLNNNDIGMMMPQILNLDHSVQNLPKLLPSPFSILMRKLKKPSKYYTEFINQYELREVPKDTVYNAPVLSGCFTLLNLKAIKQVGMYDDRFFMYFEDWDLSRRMHYKYRTVYYPLVSVYHGYESGANKGFKLFKIFIQSAVTYFNKWGWFFDKERKKINKAALAQFST